jgi:alpha-L-rhamnosidase
MAFLKFTSRFYILILAQFLIAGSCKNPSSLTPVNLRTEYKTNPVVDVEVPRLSWELSSDVRGQVQTAYQILVASSPGMLATGQADLWDSGKTGGNATNQVEYGGKPMKSRAVCFWKVRSWDMNGEPGEWSEPATWEIGLLSKTDWKAEWIGNDLTDLGKGELYHLPPSPFFRKEAMLKSPVKKARLYVTALGLYEFKINGERIGNDYFTPGWTDYDKRVYYNTYDVTSNLREGENAFGAVLADGWYAGYLGYALLVGNPVVRAFYGDVPLLKAQIEVEYSNGEKEIIATGQAWKTSHGPIVEADILNGETYNANLEFGDWSNAGFDDSGWKSSTVYPGSAERKIESYPGNPVGVYTEIIPETVNLRPGGEYIFNMGQNFAGVVRLNVKGNKGDTIVLRFGEMLHPDGSLMTENLRKARATDTYILKGDPGGETWMPGFTYHGFQYVEASGFRYKPPADAVTGIVLTSLTPEAGSLETDNQLVNQLYSNIVWTQRSNYFDVPTDCPQRDERQGWTGDAQAYIRSATYNNDIAAFYTKWLTDLNDAQRADNTYPIYAPAPNVRATDTYSPGWSEAGIICPYTIYKTYGDTRVISRFWPKMVAWMGFLETRANGNYVFHEGSFEDISPKGGFGDWLSVGKKTPPDFLASIYFAYCAGLMKEMALAIGEKEDAGYFDDLSSKVKQAFSDYYTDGAGRFRVNAEAYGDGEGYVDGHLGFDGHTQTAYANAIFKGMLDQENKKTAGNHLADLVKSNNGSLSTGFLGVRPLLPALSATGYSHIAYQLLLNEDYPSWLFEVVNGATTIWERWDSYTKEEGFRDNASMNSFNHYAFGSVNEWMFGNMAGIKVDQPGYRSFIVKPEIAGEGINYVKASYHSINGEIISSWKKDGSNLDLHIAVPPNTRANVFIPAAGQHQVFENNKTVTNNPDMKVVGFKDGYLNLEIGSGEYNFTSENYSPPAF